VEPVLGRGRNGEKWKKNYSCPMNEKKSQALQARYCPHLQSVPGHALLYAREFRRKMGERRKNPLFRGRKSSGRPK